MLWVTRDCVGCVDGGNVDGDSGERNCCADGGDDDVGAGWETVVVVLGRRSESMPTLTVYISVRTESLKTNLSLSGVFLKLGHIF